jgi:hypothetical protein
MAAFRGSAPKRGRPPRAATTENSIRELIPPASQPTRQMELPLGEDVAPPASAPESIADQFTRQIDPMSTERRPTISRWATPDGQYIDAMERSMRRQPFISPAPGGGGRGVPPGGPFPPGAADDFPFDEVPPRQASASAPPRRFPPQARPQAGMSARDVATAVGAGALTAGALDLATRPSTNADLVAESRPAPSVEATEEVPEPTTPQAPRDYSMEARALINRLNDMRRAAGGEVPEAPAMMQEINRLLEMGNETRRATYVAAPQGQASQLFQQAQALIEQVNGMYSQGMSPNSPQVQRIMAQVRQLQAQGDAIRNRRAG